MILFFRNLFLLSSDMSSIMTVIIFGFAIFGIVLFVYLKVNQRGDSHWDEGMIPDNFHFNPDNVLEFFIASAGAIIVRDPNRFTVKYGLVNTYLRRNFPDEYYHFLESYQYSLKHVLKMNELERWANKHFSKQLKIQLLNFLAYIAIADGALVPEEREFLLVLMQKLELTISDFETQYRIHIEKEYAKPKEQVYVSSLEKYYRILGLTVESSKEEVKAAYRALVKITHPDRFMHESEEVQNSMKTKFQELQNAYEAIMQN